MKILRETVTKTVQEVDVTLPYFTKNDSNYYCIINESQALKVLFVEYPTLPPLVSISMVSVSADAKNGEPISKADFEYAYESANDYLSEQFESLRDVKSGTTVEDVLKNMDA